MNDAMTPKILISCPRCGLVDQSALCHHLRPAAMVPRPLTIRGSRWGLGTIDISPVTIEISSRTGLPKADRR